MCTYWVYTSNIDPACGPCTIMLVGESTYKWCGHLYAHCTGSSDLIRSLTTDCLDCWNLDRSTSATNCRWLVDWILVYGAYHPLLYYADRDGIKTASHRCQYRRYNSDIIVQYCTPHPYILSLNTKRKRLAARDQVPVSNRKWQIHCTETAACFFNPFCLRMCEWTNSRSTSTWYSQVLATPYPNNTPNWATSTTVQSSAATSLSPTTKQSRNLKIQTATSTQKMTKLNSGTFKKLHISNKVVHDLKWVDAVLYTYSIFIWANCHKKHLYKIYSIFAH